VADSSMRKAQCVFLGEHQHTLDDKGRVILPARFRSDLAGGIVLTLAKDRCVDVFPRAEFERRVELLAAEVEAGTAYRSDMRLFTANAYEQVPDGQGRVTIPPKLREYAGLDRDLTVNGMHRNIEIWDRATWNAYESGATSRFAQDGDA
jgi:MraZ protein